MLAEKYRPKRLDEFVDQEHVTSVLRQMIERARREGIDNVFPDLPHFLFVGPPGVGKTTLAHVFAYELNIPIYELNASDERGIEIVRTRIKTLASMVGYKIVLLDEADSMTSDAQHALRRIMEKYSRYCKFILTANEEWRIIDPIKSRCSIFRFKPLPPDKVAQVLLKVLKGENVKISRERMSEFKQAVQLLIDYTGGDLRKILNIVEALINDRREFTPENVMIYVPFSRAEEILKLVLEGKLKDAVKLLEDLYIDNKLDANVLIRQLWDAVKKIDAPDLVRAKLYEKLADVERNIKMGCSPLIQLAGWFASAYATLLIYVRGEHD